MSYRQYKLNTSKTELISSLSTPNLQNLFLPPFFPFYSVFHSMATLSISFSKSENFSTLIPYTTGYHIQMMLNDLI